MIIHRRALLGSLTFALAPALTFAQTPSSPLTPDDQRAVDQVIAYLQGLGDAKGRFVQTSPRARPTAGTFYLQRPGRARFDYDPPSGLVIASDGRVVSVVDRRLKTIHVYPLGGSPLGLFLAKDIRLDRGVRVSRVVHARDTLTVVARDAKKASAGSIALNFNPAPIALSGWTLTDARGGVVTVRLEGFERSESRENGFFKLLDPRVSDEIDATGH